MAEEQADLRQVIDGARKTGFRIEAYRTAEDAARACAFNQRLRSHGLTEYLLGEQPPAVPSPEAAIRNHFYLVHEDDFVRGGFLLSAFPAGFGDGGDIDVLNAREPVSEALIDPKYSILAVRMLKFFDRQGPYLFALGMGSESRPFPRLLGSAKWTLRQAPFLFRVVRARRFLRQLPMLRTSPARKALAAAAASAGAGKIALVLMQHRALFAWRQGDFSIEPVRSWEGWVDDLWAAWRGSCSFAVSRDLRTVRELHPLGDRDRAYLLRRNGRPAGWMCARISPMRGHPHFADLTVATLVDGVMPREEMTAAVSLVSRTLAREGADLLVTNQTHVDWVAAFRAAGYLRGPSNYILALSKQLAADIGSQEDGFERMHFNRGDSDGRIHL